MAFTTRSAVRSFFHAVITSYSIHYTKLYEGRTARSLAYLLGKFDRTKLYFIAPDEMQIKPDILEYLDKHNVSYECTSTADGILPHVDVVYQTRINRERLQKRDIDLTPYNT